MSEYDFEAAKRYIQMHSDVIERATLGMKEDWFWTAETVYEDGKFTIELNDKTKIGGISSSDWATPTLEIEFKDGREITRDCYKGEVGGDSKKPPYFALGCLSQECQDIRDGKYITDEG